MQDRVAATGAAVRAVPSPLLDPSVIWDFAQAAEALGYSHLLVYDHVLGAHPDREPRLTGPSTHETTFHEPFVLLGYLAGQTTTLGLVTGIIILPQRQTAPSQNSA